MIKNTKLTANFGQTNNLESESKLFFGYINKYQVEEIKKFLEEKKHEIWKYTTNDEIKETVIHISIKLTDINIISKILFYCQTNLSKEQFTELINKKNTKGITALHYASFQGNIDIIKYLINYGADILALTTRNLNVLHFASQGNQPNALVYYYIFHKDKINLEKVDKGGSTPLHWACYSGSVEIAMYLINYNVSINIKDLNGNTPLHLAVIKSSYKMVQKLLQNGADPSIRNIEGKIPKNIALKNKSTDIYKLLQDSEKCQFCNIKAPTQKIKKSKRNIIIVFIFHLLTAFILFFIIFPYIIQLDIKLLYSILFWIYISTTIFFFLLYLRLIFMDPGRPKKCLSWDIIEQIFKQKEVKLNLIKYCPKCLVKKGKTLKHCVTCDQCCEEFDHHCYWVNNCIGKYNYKYFIEFLFLSSFNVFWVLIICIVSLFCGKFDENKKKCPDDLFNSFQDFQIFPICLLISNSRTIKTVFSISLLSYDLFFLIPQFLLILVHIHNINEKNKKKKRRSTILTNTNDDYLLSELMDSDQEYGIIDFTQ